VHLSSVAWKLLLNALSAHVRLLLTKPFFSIFATCTAVAWLYILYFLAKPMSFETMLDSLTTCRSLSLDSPGTILKTSAFLFLSNCVRMSLPLGSKANTVLESIS
jgi:hypothetical protein